MVVDGGIDASSKSDGDTLPRQRDRGSQPTGICAPGDTSAPGRAGLTGRRRSPGAAARLLADYNSVGIASTSTPAPNKA